jgi:osmotically-inducible protein OsmY
MAMLGCVLAAGCNRQDADCLRDIGHKLAADLVGDIQDSVHTGVQGVCDHLSLETRVSARLRWDRNLAGAAIEVKAQGADIELKGTLADPNQRRRAVELAESTTGVDKVVDSLELPSPTKEPDLAP